MCIYFKFICRTNHPECAFTLLHPLQRPVPPATPATACTPCNGLLVPPATPATPMLGLGPKLTQPQHPPKNQPHAAMLRSPQFLNPAP